MRSHNLFSKIRTSTIGILIRDKISDFPGYQSYPKGTSSHYLKVKVRASLSLVSQILVTSDLEKKRILILKEMKNSKNLPVLLIGNGPSASTLTIEQIDNFRRSGGSIAVMNSFYKSDLADLIKPDYYFVVDPEHWTPKLLSNFSLKSELQEYFTGKKLDTVIVQPAQFDELCSGHSNYLFVDGRSCQGLWRGKRPDRPWGLPASVSMIAISTLDYLGHSKIYFTGLDSTFVSFFEVDDMNNVINPGIGQHFYSHSPEVADLTAPITGIEKYKAPYRDLADLYFAHGIFLRDLSWLCADKCINVGNDKGNQSSPRACLLPKNFEAETPK